MTHLETPITPTQRANLAKLADYLDALPVDYAHFRMEAYAGIYINDRLDDEFDPGHIDETFTHDCGTCACAVGHGPLAGMPPLHSEGWQGYEKRVFGVSQGNPNSAAWNYAFGPYNDDDAKAAAVRIREVLADNGA